MANFLPTYNYEYSSDRKSELECRENITETLETQRFVEDIVKSRVPPPLDVETAKNQQTIASISKMEEYSSSSAYHQTENITNTYQAENTTNFQSDSCELRRPTHFSPNTVECTLPSRIENAVPLKWESALTQAIRTTAPDADTFAQIPSKSSHSAFASALSIAPSRPFTPTTTHDEAVPLPEETVPYMPPERPILPVRDEELKPEQAERPKSQFVRALETVPDTPHKLKDGVAPPIRKKTKDPAEKFLEELPKPQEKLSMLAALTTAPERPYSPLVVESIVGLDKSESKTNSQFDKSQLHKPLKPDVLPDSFKINKKEPKPPTYYPPTVLYQKTQETTSEEQLEESESSKIRTIEKETIHNPEVTQVVVNEGQAVSQNFAPMFQGFSCSFQNKTEHSQFSVSVSTTPPVMSPPPKAVTTSVTTIENKPGYVQKEIITEEERKRQQSTKKHEQSREESRREVQERAKQAEEVIVKKPVQPVALHKAEYIPSYQVEISAEAEAQLQRMEKMEKAQIRLEQQKITTQQAQQTNHTQQDVNKPVIRIESEIEEQAEPHRLFRPLEEDRPPSRTFSPRPGSITPSNISKPPAVLPYYQANLVAQPMAPAPASLFDPKSPAVSRSPSPCLRERSRSPSPSPSLLSTKSNVRPVSPAAGPPPNPLKSSKPLPNPHDTKVNQARENLTTFIPEYKNKRELVEKTRGMDFQKRVEDSKPSQMYVSTIQTQNFPVQQQGDMIVRQEEMYDARKMDMSESHSSQKYTAQTDNTVMSTAVEEQIRQAHLEQMKKCQSESLERSADGRTQIQRKKIVTEEYERSQKETNIQIERNVTTTKKHPFQDVKAPSVEAPVVRGHLTDPQVLSSSIGRQKNVRDTAKTSSSSSASLTPSAKITAADVAAPIKHVFAPSAIAPVKHVTPPTSSKRPNQNVISPSVSRPDTGAGSGRQTGGVSIAPKRGRGVLNPASLRGARIPLCGHCNMQIRGPFITALGKIWCPNHFICSTPSCRRPLQDLGFVEEKGQLYCEYCFEQYLAPQCSKCGSKIKGDCLKAIGKNFHPECFNCTYCGKLFGNSPFFLEDGSPYCEADWNELFTTKCFACGFPVEAGDRWVEALNNNYHSQCFNCTMCKKNLEGQSFFAKGGRPFCKNHAR